MRNEGRKRRSLGAAIRRTLVVRLGAAGLVVSLAAGTAAFFVERGRVREQVVDIGDRAVARFNHQVFYLLDRSGPVDAPALQHELEDFSTKGGASRTGRFVTARIYDMAGEQVAGIADRDYAYISDVEALLNAAEPGDVDDYRRTYTGRIAGKPHILVVLPLVNSAGRTVARVEGVFALSEAAITDISRHVSRAITLVIAIVAVTTLLIYPIIANLLGRVTRMTESLLDSNLETLKVLGSAIAKRDSDTDAHNYRVTVMAVRLAEKIGLDEAAIRAIIKGGFLHDVGKIGIRDNILLKPGPLTDEEYEVMKTHVDHGLDIVQRSEWLRDATDIVACHHEKFGGGGYAKGLSGEHIPIAARIFAIADVFDALSSKRPYKEPLPFDEAMSVLEQGRGTHFDPALLDAFEAIAAGVYDAIANRDREPRRELDRITQKYFKDNLRVV